VEAAAVSRQSEVKPDPHQSSRLVTAGDLEIRCEASGRHHVLKLAGELDLAGVDVLRAELDRCADGAEMTVVDLQRLMFIDSTGLCVLFYALERAKAERRRLVFTRSSPEVERTVHLSGLDRVLGLDSRAGEPRR
jgi:anti-sigma B factor antagonist